MTTNPGAGAVRAFVRGGFAVRGDIEIVVALRAFHFGSHASGLSDVSVLLWLEQVIFRL